jgi:hypothetical protein
MTEHEETEIPNKALRDKLRAYALEYEIKLVSDGENMVSVQRGEIGAKAFVALQRVLDVLGQKNIVTASFLRESILFEIERTL